MGFLIDSNGEIITCASRTVHVHILVDCFGSFVTDRSQLLKSARGCPVHYYVTPVINLQPLAPSPHVLGALREFSTTPLPCFWETLRPGKRNWQPRRPPRHPEWRPETGCAVGRKTGNHQRTESTEQGTLWLDLCGSKAYNTCLLLFLSPDFRFRCQKHHCIALHFVLTVIN